jgi:hypothetical protein
MGQIVVSFLTPVHVHVTTQIGFFGILIVEAIANKGILEMAGFTVGGGLGFEF